MANTFLENASKGKVNTNLKNLSQLPTNQFQAIPMPTVRKTVDMMINAPQPNSQDFTDRINAVNDFSNYYLSLPNHEEVGPMERYTLASILQPAFKEVSTDFIAKNLESYTESLLGTKLSQNWRKEFADQWNVYDIQEQIADMQRMIMFSSEDNPNDEYYEKKIEELRTQAALLTKDFDKRNKIAKWTIDSAGLANQRIRQLATSFELATLFGLVETAVNGVKAAGNLLKFKQASGALNGTLVAGKNGTSYLVKPVYNALGEQTTRSQLAMAVGNQLYMNTDMMKVEMGDAFQTIRDYRDEEGNRVPKSIARKWAENYGTLVLATEQSDEILDVIFSKYGISFGSIFTQIGLGRDWFKQAANLMKSNGFIQKVKNLLGLGVGVVSEAGQEGVQAAGQEALVQAAIMESNKKGYTNIDLGTIKDRSEKIWNALKTEFTDTSGSFIISKVFETTLGFTAYGAKKFIHPVSVKAKSDANAHFKPGGKIVNPFEIDTMGAVAEAPETKVDKDGKVIDEKLNAIFVDSPDVNGLQRGYSERDRKLIQWAREQGWEGIRVVEVPFSASQSAAERLANIINDDVAENFINESEQEDYTPNTDVDDIEDVDTSVNMEVPVVGTKDGDILVKNDASFEKVKEYFKNNSFTQSIITNDDGSISVRLSAGDSSVSVNVRVANEAEINGTDRKVVKVQTKADWATEMETPVSSNPFGKDEYLYSYEEYQTIKKLEDILAPQADKLKDNDIEMMGQSIRGAAKVMPIVSDVFGKPTSEILEKFVFTIDPESEKLKIRDDKGNLIDEAIAGIETTKKNGVQRYRITIGKNVRSDTLMHEIIHGLRKMATPEQLSGFAEAYGGTVGGMWLEDIKKVDGGYRLGDTVYKNEDDAKKAASKYEERFVDDFMRYLYSHEGFNDAQRTFFSKVQQFFEEFWDQMRSILSKELDASVVRAFDILFGKDRPVQERADFIEVAATEGIRTAVELANTGLEDIVERDMDNGLDEEGNTLWQRAGDINSEQFINWFKGSKVVNSDGSPMVVYHGTNELFEDFEHGKASNTYANSAKNGFFFTSNRRVADSYLSNRRLERIESGEIVDIPTNPRVMEVYLHMENPLEFNAKSGEKKTWNDLFDEAKKNGHDGIIIRNIIDAKTGVLSAEERQYYGEADDYIVFSNDQIRIKDSGLPENYALYQRIMDRNTQARIDADYESVENALRADSSNFDSEGNHLAPNGKKSNLTYKQWVQVRTPAFMDWFGDWISDPENASKMIDTNGEPIVFYHGSDSDFDTFERSYIGTAHDSGFFGEGFYFAFHNFDNYHHNRDEASYYGHVVRAFFLNIRNPFNAREAFYGKGDSLFKSDLKAMLNVMKNYSEVDWGSPSFWKDGELQDYTREEMVSLIESKWDFAEKHSKTIEVEGDQGKEYFLQIERENPSYEWDIFSGFSETTREEVEKTREQTIDRYVREELGLSDVPSSIRYYMEGTNFTDVIKQRGFDGIIQSMAGDEAVVFSPNQIKSATDNSGAFSTENDSILYQTNDGSTIQRINGTLVVTHNLSSAKLKGVVEIGGMPMPSLAISRPDVKIDSFGEITLVGDSYLANRIMSRGEMFDRDTWSPTAPRPIFRVNKKGLDAFDKWIKELPNIRGEGKIYSQNLYDSQKDSPQELASHFGHLDFVRLEYAKEHGIEVEIPYMPKRYNYDTRILEAAKAWGEKNNTKYLSLNQVQSFFDAIKPQLQAVISEQEEKFRKELEANPSMSEFKQNVSRGRIDYYNKELNESNFSGLSELLTESMKYEKGKMEFDKWALKKKLDEVAPAEDVQKWLIDTKFGGIFSEPKIKVGGKLVPYNLDNIFKYMLNAQYVGNGQGTITYSNSLAASLGARPMTSRSEVAAKEKYLADVKDDSYDEQFKVYHDVAIKNYKYSDTWDALDDSNKAIAKFLTSDDRSDSNLRKQLKNLDFNVTDELFIEAKRLVDSIENMERRYFEGKPRRIMNLSDFKYAIVPTETKPETIEILNNSGLQIVVSDNRTQALSDITKKDTGILFQLSDEEKKKALESRKYEIETATAGGYWVRTEYIEEFAGEDWADRELKVRHWMQEKPDDYKELKDIARRVGDYQEFKEELHKKYEDNWFDEDEFFYKRIYQLAQTRTAQEKDSEFIARNVMGDDNLLRTAKALKGYADLDFVPKPGRRSGGYYKIIGQLNRAKGVSNKVRSLSNGEKGKERSTSEEIQAARELILKNPRAYRMAYEKAMLGEDRAGIIRGVEGKRFETEAVRQESNDLIMNYDLDTLDDRLEAELYSMQEEQLQAEKKANLAEAKKTDWKKTAAQLEKKLAQANADLEKLNTEKLSRQQAQKQRDEAIAERNELRKQMTELQNQLSETKAERRQFKAQRDERRERVKELRGQLVEANRKVRTLSRILDAYERREAARNAKEVRDTTIAKIRKTVRIGKTTFSWHKDALDASYADAFAFINGIFAKVDRSDLYAKRKELEDLIDEMIEQQRDPKEIDAIDDELENIKEQIRGSEMRKVPEVLVPYLGSLQKADNRHSKWTLEELSNLLTVAQTIRQLAKDAFAPRFNAVQTERNNTVVNYVKEMSGIDISQMKADERRRLASTFPKDVLVRNVVLENLDWWRALAANPAGMTRFFDGEKEGVIFDFFTRQVRQQMQQEIERENERYQAGKEKIKELGLNSIELNKVIELEDGYTYKKANGEKVKLTVDNGIDVYIYMQNEDAKMKLLHVSGNGLTEKLAKRIIDALTPEQKAWGDWMMAELESHRQDSADIMYNVYNSIMGQVDRYFPLVSADRLYGGDDGLDIMSGAEGSTKRYVNKGHTKERVKVIYPLDLNATRTWVTAVKKEEHFVAFAKWARDAQYYMDTKTPAGIRNVILQKYGPKNIEIFSDYVNSIANAKSYSDNVDKLLSTIIGRGAVSAVAGKLSVMFKQVATLPAVIGKTSFKNFLGSAFAPRVTLENFLKANEILFADYTSARDFVNKKDPIMANRKYGTELIGSLTNMGKKPIDAVASNVSEWIMRHSAGATDAYITKVVWLSCYMTTFENLKKQAQKKGVSFNVEAADKEAVFQASQLISETQNTSLDMDMSYIMRKAKSNPVLKPFVLFSSTPMNLMTNLAYGIPRNIRNKNWKGIAHTIAYVTLAMFGNMAINGAFRRKKDEDDEEFAKRMWIEIGAETVSTLMPGYGGSFASMIRGSFTDTTGDISLISDITRVGRKGIKKVLNPKDNQAGWELFGELLYVGAESFGFPAGAAKNLVKSAYNLNPGYLINKTFAEIFEENFK